MKTTHFMIMDFGSKCNPEALSQDDAHYFGGDFAHSPHCLRPRFASSQDDAHYFGGDLDPGPIVSGRDLHCHKMMHSAFELGSLCIFVLRSDSMA
jgi:hypothetical protein